VKRRAARLAVASAFALLAWPKIESGIGSASNEHGDYDYAWCRVFLGGHVIELHWTPWR
jgi:hypothetical protein